MSEPNENRGYSIWQHERELTRAESHAKSWKIGFWVVFAILIATIAAWIITDKLDKPQASEGGYYDFYWMIPEEEEGPTGPAFG